MPLVSAINADSRNIYAGAPVAGKFSRFQLDRVILAGGNVLAAGIVKSGSVRGGVINVFTEGILNLDDWTPATGSKYLTTGSVYRLASTSGKITPSGSGQVIGLAVSRQQLSLQLSSVGGNGSTSVITGDLAAETSARITRDNLLTSQISAEASARTNSDIALQSQITELQQPRYSTELLLSGM